MESYLISSSIEGISINIFGTPKECIAKLTPTYAEFIDPVHIKIPNCTFDQFREVANKLGYEVKEHHRPLQM